MVLKQLGSYTIQSLIGAGGMGEVYRARDAKLGRDVALKVLPAVFASDPERLSRFEREALLLGSLNHPNIATIHGIEDDGGVRALVLELVEGPTLAEKLASGSGLRASGRGLPLDEALSIARQIADALQAAHDHGVIHRDLKPANIKVRPDGTVKVLDFGLAKIVESPAKAGHYQEGSRGVRLQGDLSNSPTMMASTPGLLLGTAAYMAPEQAKGLEADRRSDVWAFGCVLFEMLAGHRAFEGNSSSELIANVLKSEPEWHRLPADTPEAIRRLLRRCLQKDEKRRLRDIADARLELEDARSESHVLLPAASSAGRGLWRFAWPAVAGLLLLLAIGLGLRAARTIPTQPELQFDVLTPPGWDPDDLASVSLAPDGRTLVFVAASENESHLWIRSLDSVAVRPVPGTAGAYNPFWSPDGRTIAFYAGGQLKRVDLDGGLVRSLAQATRGVGGSWNRDGVILFGPNPASPIFRVPADGGSPVRVTALAANQAGHGAPSFLPDGQHFLFIAYGAPEGSGVHLGDMNGTAPRKLVDGDTAAAVTAGHLLFVRQGTVFGQPFDAQRLELQGSPFPVMEGLASSVSARALSSTSNGMIAVCVVGSPPRRNLMWVDRSGRELSSFGHLDVTPHTGFSPSPNAEQLVYMRRENNNSDVWLVETRRNVATRLTSTLAEDIFPAWSRDGRVVFTSNRNGGFSLYRKATAGNDTEEMILPVSPEETFASDTTPDGRIVLLQRRSPKTSWDIWALRPGGEPTLTPVVQTQFDDRDAQLSPDGRWLAYVANNSGRFEVFVQPFPGPGQRQQVSTKGGFQLRWRPDGRELFYIAPDKTMTAVPIDAPAAGQLTIGSPVTLFPTRLGSLANPGPMAEFIASPDGTRFLINNYVDGTSASPIRVFVNWRGKS